jgi:hypothetical protein
MLEVQLNLTISVANIFVLLIISSSTACGIGIRFGTRWTLNFKEMLTSALTTTVTVVFILLRWVLDVNIVIWVNTLTFISTESFINLRK